MSLWTLQPLVGKPCAMNLQNIVNVKCQGCKEETLHKRTPSLSHSAVKAMLFAMQRVKTAIYVLISCAPL